MGSVINSDDDAPTPPESDSPDAFRAFIREVLDWVEKRAVAAKVPATSGDDEKLVDTFAECVYNDACDGRCTASDATQQARDALIRRLAAVAPSASAGAAECGPHGTGEFCEECEPSASGEAGAVELLRAIREQDFLSDSMRSRIDTLLATRRLAEQGDSREG